MIEVAPPVSRICLIATHFAEYSILLARALREAGADVLLVINPDNARAEMGEDFVRDGCDGLHTHFVRKTFNPFALLSQVIGLIRAVRSFAPLVIHVQEDSKDVLACALAFLPRVPLILTMHDPKPHSGADSRTRNRSRHGIYIDQLRRRADAVIVHGEQLVSDARDSVPSRQIPVFAIPHGPLGISFSLPPDSGQDRMRCLFFGRIEAYKGLRHFIAVIQLLNQRGIRAFGVVAGRGSDLENYRDVLGDTSKFEVIEKFLSPEEVVQQFSQARVVVMPYDNATQSGVAAYALGLGRAVVAFDVGALREMVCDGKTGRLVPHGNLPALADAIEEIIENQEVAESMQSNALLLGHTDFSWRAIAGMTLTAYATILGKVRHLTAVNSGAGVVR